MPVVDHEVHRIVRCDVRECRSQAGHADFVYKASVLAPIKITSAHRGSRDEASRCHLGEEPGAISEGSRETTRQVGPTRVGDHLAQLVDGLFQHARAAFLSAVRILWTVLIDQIRCRQVFFYESTTRPDILLQ